MLPSAACAGGVNLFDSRQWPGSGPQPDLELLRRGREINAMLALDDERMRAIVGIGQETVTAAVKRRDDFLYTVTRRGDGTVPAASAAIPGPRNYFAAVPHSELTRDPVVAAAIADLLRHGTTRRLPARWLSQSRAEAHITDRQLRRLHRDKVDWAGLEPQQRREFLQGLNEPPKLRRVKPRREAATPCKERLSTVVWFRQDLRLQDNPALESAAACGAVCRCTSGRPRKKAGGRRELPRAGGCIAHCRGSIGSCDSAARV